eukprot:TRINITY_DN4527_c0_g1_i3.p3 TRINITY_DN4527_c0_g1~~TRINITY_DN4527_c0_g1_i3.p3  ORF type:complete len:134 (+),score=23.55 TRINITY_DN4527_c0_g1_i3:247-648(+)
MDKSMHNCRCSWCLDPTTHMCTKDNSGKKKRSIYECGACHNRTLPCKKGCGAMTKGGFWDNDKCAKCSGDIKDWPTTAEQRTAMRANMAAAAEKRAAQNKPSAAMQKRQAAAQAGQARAGRQEDSHLDPARWN